jgi:hypothetical protein
MNDSDCFSHHRGGRQDLSMHSQPRVDNFANGGSTRSVNGTETEGLQGRPMDSVSIREDVTSLFAANIGPRDNPSATHMRVNDSGGLTPTTYLAAPTRQGHQDNRSVASHESSRRKVARALLAVARNLTTVPYDAPDLEMFKYGKASDYPEIPGEQTRNVRLMESREQYNRRRNSHEHLASVMRERGSRAGSFVGSTASGAGSVTMHGALSAHQVPTRSSSADLDEI